MPLSSLLRFVVLVPFAFVLSALTAGVVINQAYYIHPLLSARWVDPFTQFGLAGGMMLRIGAIAFLPAMVAIIVAETLVLRSIVYWAAVGATISVGALLTAVPLRSLASSVDLLLIHISAGFSGALVYWAIAGRFSGVGLKKRRP